MPPQRSNLILPTDIPYCELDVLVFDGLDVEACAKESIKKVGEKGSRRTDSGNRGAVEY